MAGSRRGVPHKASIVARNELISKGINPVDMLMEIYTLSVAAYKSGRGLTDKGDAGATYLSAAGNAASNLMKYYAPQLGAIAIEVNDSTEKKITTVIDARNIVKADPFFQHSVKVADIAKNPDRPVRDIELAIGNNDPKPS